MRLKHADDQDKERLLPIESVDILPSQICDGEDSAAGRRAGSTGDVKRGKPRAN